MKIYYTTNSNILRAPQQAIVIPVNTLGIAGAGLAKQWAIRYPVEARAYKLACKENRVRVGDILTVISSVDTHIFLCFPTKMIPQRRSELIWIDKGLAALQETISVSSIKSVAVPALGCGLGGLPWSRVKPLIEHYMSALKIPIYVYLPRAPRSLQ